MLSKQNKLTKLASKNNSLISVNNFKIRITCMNRKLDIANVNLLGKKSIFHRLICIFQKSKATIKAVKKPTFQNGLSFYHLWKRNNSAFRDRWIFWLQCILKKSKKNYLFFGASRTAYYIPKSIEWNHTRREPFVFFLSVADMVMRNFCYLYYFLASVK